MVLIHENEPRYFFGNITRDSFAFGRYPPEHDVTR